MKSATDRLIETLLSTGINMTEISHLLLGFMEEEMADYIGNNVLQIKNYKSDPFVSKHKSEKELADVLDVTKNLLYIMKKDAIPENWATFLLINII